MQQNATQRKRKIEIEKDEYEKLNNHLLTKQLNKDKAKDRLEVLADQIYDVEVIS